MNKLLTIAMDEWRFWFRSRLALWGIGVFCLLLLATGVLSVLQVNEAEHEREHAQEQAEERFLSQPARHPHRMVHYGHYVFRAPAPLAVFDPGLDAVTGQSVFLEGHRQNSATFAQAGASASLGGLAWLTPALVYQLFGSLLLVILGYGAIVREREAATLPTLLMHGTGGEQLVFGKWLALVSLATVMLVPVVLVGWLAEGFAAALSLAATYLIYLIVWASVVVLLSTTIRGRSTVLSVATSLWLAVCLLVPSLAVDAVSRSTLHAGKIQTDLALLEEARKLGDGHNASDPAFAALRANLLAQYNVDRIEDLPVNYRGVVATEAEEKLTVKLNEFAESQMSGERQQAIELRRFGWISPTLAVAAASRAIAGTDIDHYHRFLREAEVVRYSFVQALNNVHATELAYATDMGRGDSEEASMRARVSADNWRVLDDFSFVPASLSERVSAATPALVILTVWTAILLGGLFFAGRRLQP
jgi:ABC-2 type transport system permease protein